MKTEIFTGIHLCMSGFHLDRGVCTGISPPSLGMQVMVGIIIIRASRYYILGLSVLGISGSTHSLWLIQLYMHAFCTHLHIFPQNSLLEMKIFRSKH